MLKKTKKKIITILWIVGSIASIIWIIFYYIPSEAKNDILLKNSNNNIAIQWNNNILNKNTEINNYKNNIRI
jgi:hypothetical protein